MDSPSEPPQATPGSSSNIDDASMHTITATSLNNQNPTYDARPQTSYSDTGFSRAYSQSADNTPDREQRGEGLSRPPSTNAHGDNRSKAEKNSSVVIKVGMVGDAQIGKTSLMVKYVEGSWDEDYIQTLGKTCQWIAHAPTRLTRSQASISWRRQSPSETQRSHSPFGISADSASS